MKIITVKKERELLLIPDAIIDVTGGDVLRNKALLISKGRIKELFSLDAAYRLAEREKIESISLAGITLMPGLIDCHVHFALDGVDFHQALERWDNEVLLNHIIIKNQQMKNMIENEGSICGKNWKDYNDHKYIRIIIKFPYQLNGNLYKYHLIMFYQLNFQLISRVKLYKLFSQYAL